MINEFSPSRFRELINEGVGALLIIIPSDLESLTDDMREVREFYLFTNQELLKKLLGSRTLLIQRSFSSVKRLLYQCISLPILPN